MTSILTNNGAMTALQTLKGVNMSLGKTQDEIATGKAVASAKDNSAIWAISKVMESDVKGFKSISESLNLGESTVAVARQASESVTDLLTKMKGAIVSSQQDNVDRTKLQADIASYTDAINTIVGSAQFNGLNLVNGSAGATINVLSSLDRAADGSVASSSITVSNTDLSTGNYVAKAAFTGSDGASTDADVAGFQLDKATGTGTLVLDAATAFAEGDKLSVTVGGKTASYTISAADAASTTPGDIAAVGLKNAIDALGIADLTVDYDSGTPGTLSFTNGSTRDLAVSAQFKNAGSGGLSALSSIDVSTKAGATAALGNIETLIQTSVDAAASFGTSQSRLTTQKEFISKLSDALTSGIGTLVDANMEEASAKLQALQVQQQLGIQALSIANQAPQNVLSLFR